MPKFFEKMYLKHPYDPKEALPKHLTKEEKKTPVLSDQEQAAAIYKRFKEVLAREDAPQKVGITYSANHNQTLALSAFYKTPNEATWQEVINKFNGSENQGSVIHLLLTELGKLPLADRTQFVILPISTMGKAGKTITEPQNDWLEANLNNIQQFVNNGGFVLGWRNQFTAPGKLAIGGGVASKVFGLDQNQYVQDYFRQLELASNKNQPAPPPSSFADFEIKYKQAQLAQEAAAAAIKDDLKDVPVELEDENDIELDVFNPNKDDADDDVLLAEDDPEDDVLLDDDDPDNDVSLDENDANDKDIPANSDPLQNPGKKDVTIRNVRNRFEEYAELINYFKSQIIIAHEQVDPSRLDRIRKAAENLKTQLMTYDDYLQTNPAAIRKELNEKSIIEGNIQDIENLLKIQPHPTQRVRTFSSESEVAASKDKVAELVEKYLSGGSGNPAKPESAGSLIAGPLTLDETKSTEGFAKTGRVNLIELPYGTRFVSEQGMDKDSYYSKFHLNGPLDTSREWHLGYTLPNKTLLKLAIAEVQNFRAGNPNLERTMKIAGNMPKELVESIVLYCEHKGFPYSNDTIHKIDLSSAQQNGYKSLLKHSPQDFLIHAENAAILVGDKKLSNLSDKTHINEPPKHH